MFIITVFIGCIVQNVVGTFPPVRNGPPIPGQGLRALDVQSAQQFYNEDDSLPLQPTISDGPFLPDDDQRWFVQERQFEESPNLPSERFARFYPNGDPAVGPVATPLPDEAYVTESSNTLNNKPDGSDNIPEIWVLTRNGDSQLPPEQWLSLQAQNSEVIDVANQDSDPAVATDIVKSIAVPVTDSLKSQNFPIAPVQQIFIRTNSAPSLKKTLSNSPPIVGAISSVPQLLDSQQGDVKQISQQPTTKTTYSFPPSSIKTLQTSVPVKQSFSVPPPQPPPIKGGVVTPKIAVGISNSIPVSQLSNPTATITGKNALLQQLRHIWIPTSSRTGRFISIPISNVQSGKSAISNGIPLGSAPVSISDTWVLKQNGVSPSFEQVKVFPETIVQTGKTITQNIGAVVVDQASTIKQTNTQVFPKQVPVLGRIVPTGIWPIRNDLKPLVGKQFITSSPVKSLPPSQPNTVSISKSTSFPIQPVLLQNVYSQAPLKFSSTGIQLINGKPCPIPPSQTTIVTSKNTAVPVPQVIVPQAKQPLSRIIDVNRFPTGSYYVLNAKVRPNFLTYPTPPALVQQFKPGLVQIGQTKVPPVQPQAKQTTVPISYKSGFAPTQPQIISPPIPTRFVAYSLPLQPITPPVTSQKYPSQILYPPLQGIRYIYPLDVNLKSNSLLPPVSFIRQSNPVFLKTIKSGSGVNSSEASSEDKDKKKEENKDKIKKEESNESKEKESKNESGENSGEKEKEGAEESKSESKESKEAAESQVYSQFFKPPRSSNQPYVFRIDPYNRNRQQTKFIT